MDCFRRKPPIFGELIKLSAAIGAIDGYFSRFLRCWQAQCRAHGVVCVVVDFESCLIFSDVLSSLREAVNALRCRNI